MDHGGAAQIGSRDLTVGAVFLCAVQQEICVRRLMMAWQWILGYFALK
jgi:hypothetical protein